MGAETGRRNGRKKRGGILFLLVLLGLLAVAVVWVIG